VDELEALATWLAEPNTRLVTLTGLGGSGKTRLALEAGARLAERDHRALTGGSPLTFPHGIVFVPLAALDSVDGLVPALADALSLRLEGGQEQMLEFLRPKQLLLILDNLEQLPSAAGFLTKIVGAAPGVKIMATSRDRLQVQGEHVLALGGLPYPEHDLGHSLPKDVDLDAYLATYPALQLLAEGIRRIRSRLLPSSADLPVMVDICRLVDGLPLALELAASWADTLSLSDILAETQRGLDFLHVNWSDLPERQRSIRAVFDASWRRLNPAEQAAFLALSVFRGSFSREAAEEVVAGEEATPRLLAALVRKSFLQYDQAEARYQIQELLCQYGAEKLAHEPVRQVELRDRHSAHYTRSLRRWETDLKGPRQKAALSEMEADRENIRSAWNRAAEQGQVERLDRAMDGLAHFYWVRGPYRDGEDAFRIAANLLKATANQLPSAAIRRSALPVPSAGEGSSAEGMRVLARSLAWQSNFSRLRGRKVLAGELQKRSLDLLEGPGLAGHDTRREKALLFSIMGHTVHMSDHEQGRQCYERSLELYRELGDRWWTAQALDGLGTAARFMGSDGEARRLLEESLAIFQTLGHPPSIARLLANLAGVSLRRGQFKEAESLARESSARSRKLRDQLGLAYSLLIWGASLEKVARFGDAHSAIEECLAIYEELGNPHYIVSAHAALGSAKLHLGRYDQARAQAETALVRARKAGTRFRIGHALLLLGCVALAEEAYAEAQQFLQDSITAYREIGESADLGLAIAVAGYAARGLGRVALSQQHLCMALQLLIEIQTLEPYLYALSAAALSLADQGEIERAVELYALASRYPFVSDSHWFEDVVGQQIAAVAATLPAERVAVLQERGQARDLAATAAELLAELRT
jgi:predicted ATPase